MKKKILSVIAILALVSVLAVVLVACNPSSYEKKLEDAGYDKVTVSEEDSDAVKLANKGLEIDGGYEGKISWIVTGTKLGISLSGVDAGAVSIYKFEKSADAKKYVEDNGGESDKLVRKGSVVIFGDADSVALVK